MANFRGPESGVTVTAGVELLRDVRLDERLVTSYDLRYTAWLDPHRENRESRQPWCISQSPSRMATLRVPAYCLAQPAQRSALDVRPHRQLLSEAIRMFKPSSADTAHTRQYGR
jgi:hypothetical protein